MFVTLDTTAIRESSAFAFAVAPFQSKGYERTISATHLPDPAARAQYTQALQRNQQRIDDYNRLWQLHQLDKFFVPNARRFLAHAYSRVA